MRAFYCIPFLIVDVMYAFFSVIVLDCIMGRNCMFCENPPLRMARFMLYVFVSCSLDLFHESLQKERGDRVL